MMSTSHIVYEALRGLRICEENGRYLEERDLGRWVENVRQFYWHAHRVRQLSVDDALDLYTYLTRDPD